MRYTFGILIAALIFAAILAVILARTLIDRQQAQLEIQKSEEKYRNIFNNAVEGFFRSTPDGRFIDVNPAFSKMIGYESPEELVSSISDIGTLAGGIAHDFNNILTSIIGYTELVLEDAEKGSQLETSLQEVFAAGKRARDLVQQILTFARKSETQPQPIPIKEAAREALRFLRSTIPAHIEIKQDLKSDASVMGESSQIHQLFLNLCTNAAQAMDSDGGVLQIHVKDTDLSETILKKHPDIKAGRHIEISVSDTGPGIPEEHLDSIFEPYYTSKDIGEGTGLGLAVVHGIVKSYGGEISVESTVGKGTVFTVYLPITETDPEEPGPASKRLPEGIERILFVDDEEPIAKMGKAILGRLGYQVTAVSDSLEALALFRSDPAAFDLVVTDMSMPQKNGDKLAEEILEIRPDIAVILCTGYSKQIDDRKAKKIGIRAFVMKPLDRLQLTQLVRKVLDEAKPSRAE
ncbi:MAG: response regulator [Desulfobacterales bacterium]|nr:response regulator [Desulfobacterales bacterium]